MRGLLFVLSAVSAVAAAACSRSDASTSLPAPDASFAAAPSVTLALVDAARPPSPKRPPADLNVIFLSVDCLRADMPWAGYPRPIAPRLTELEKRAVSYTHAYSMSSYTSMSLGGLLGGRPPSEMSRDGYFFSTYSRTNVMFPELLQAAGIHTMAAHAHGYFKSAGFDQGFDKYELVPNLKWNSTTDENISSPQLEGIAERMLGDPANETERFFAWFHFLDPHDQYLPHPGIGPYGPTARDRYDAEVTFTDQYIGKLLDFVATRSWASRTAIIVTADHGEAFRPTMSTSRAAPWISPLRSSICSASRRRTTAGIQASRGRASCPSCTAPPPSRATSSSICLRPATTTGAARSSTAT